MQGIEDETKISVEWGAVEKTKKTPSHFKGIRIKTRVQKARVMSRTRQTRGVVGGLDAEGFKASMKECRLSLLQGDGGQGWRALREEKSYC